MKPKDLLKRKFLLGWSDLQFLVLLELGERGRGRLMDLVEATGASTTGIWNALTSPTMEDFILKEYKGNRVSYRLTPAGKRVIVRALTRDRPAEIEALPPSETLSFSRIPSGALTVFSGRGFLC